MSGSVSITPIRERSLDDAMNGSQERASVRRPRSPDPHAHVSGGVATHEHVGERQTSPAARTKNDSAAVVELAPHGSLLVVILLNTLRILPDPSDTLRMTMVCTRLTSSEYHETGSASSQALILRHAHRRIPTTFRRPPRLTSKQSNEGARCFVHGPLPGNFPLSLPSMLKKNRTPRAPMANCGVELQSPARFQFAE